MNDHDDLERRAAQALAATFAQLSRSASLAQLLHQSRERALASRLADVEAEAEKIRLEERIEAHQQQGAAIAAAVNHLQSQMPEVVSLVRPGLTPADLHACGLDTDPKGENHGEPQ